MSAGFTPGPWKAKPAFNADDTCRIMWKEYGQGWVRERRLDRDCAGGFSPENARLLAAAPELYEALERVWDAYGMDPSVDSSIWQEVQTALAQARGEA